MYPKVDAYWQCRFEDITQRDRMMLEDSGLENERWRDKTQS